MNITTRAVTPTIFLWFLITIATLDIIFCSDVRIDSEREALLSFKNDLKDPSNRLSSWTGEDDCCMWTGVVCDNLTGHVQQLRLARHPRPGLLYPDEIEAYNRSYLSGKINPSLLNLKYLSYLNLSHNDFGGIQIPGFIGSLGSLRHLDLSRAGFMGMISHRLGNLSTLRYFNLAENDLYVDNLQWLDGLSFLEYLDLSYVNLSRAFNWLQVTNMLPSLVQLHLASCWLEHIPSLPNSSFSALSILDLSGNQFTSSIPWSVFYFSSLVSLDLTSCALQGPIPSGLRNMTSLRHLKLSKNHFNSSIPNWLYTFSRLESLHLDNNNLQGKLSTSIKNMTSSTSITLSYNKDLEVKEGFLKSLGNLCSLREINLSGIKLSLELSKVLGSLSPGCILDRLEALSMSECKLFGQLTDQLGSFEKLTFLDLSVNQISGPIPVSLGELQLLRELFLFDNQLDGTLPDSESLGKLGKLEKLWIDDNSLKGPVSETHFTNLTQLQILSASGNSLVFKVSPDWVPHFQLMYIDLSSCILRPPFPQWLHSQKQLQHLDISNTRISDTIPSWFWNLRRMKYLNLSHNQIHVEIPKMPLHSIFPSVTALDLSNNLIFGFLSKFLCEGNDNQQMLEILNLGDNLLSGEIPDCWMNWKTLIALNLENNSLTGDIPSSLGALTSLESLHLRNNSFSGKLPLSLQNCKWLRFVDLGENNFVGSIPNWVGERFSNLRILILRSNRFHGSIPNQLCALASLKVLDLAHNNLQGTIPICFSNFSAMATEQNSNDQMYCSTHTQGKKDKLFIENTLLVTKGQVSAYSTILHLVTSLDLSNNRLSGDIPVEMTSLMGLHYVNFSKNLLRGRIPEQIGAMRSLLSVDFSENKLSGEIPPSISSLTFLSHLDLSNNNLTGEIPKSTQLQSFDASSFIGNKLCGPPLIENCAENDGIPDAGNESGEDSDEFDNSFYLSMGIGFVVGFWAVFGPAIFNRTWGNVYFRFLYRMWEKLGGF